ncbi:MAG: hypothetical protein J5965_25495, partial [Aeriscardovia sp.]|nr:hypothetical protein [Aeriscardovia sp.]
MKKIEEIYELLEGIILNKAKKTVMYCEVEKTAYEIFYYSFFEDGSSKHSADLIDSGELNSLAVEKGFDKIADFVRDTDFFDEEKRNLITLIVEGTSEHME